METKQGIDGSSDQNLNDAEGKFTSATRDHELGRNQDPGYKGATITHIGSVSRLLPGLSDRDADRLVQNSYKQAASRAIVGLQLGTRKLAMLDNIGKVESFDALRMFAGSLAGLCRKISESTGVALEPPSARQWRYYCSNSGVPPHETESIVSLVSQSGSTIVAREVLVEVWLSGKVSEREEGLLRRALEDVLIDGDAIWQDSEQAVHGSYYQKLKFLAGFFGQYGGKIVANLSTAFGATADSQRVNTVERLAAIVEKHENVVIRVEGMIAIKISRNSKPITLIAVLTDDMRSHLARHPMLITQPAQLYDLLVSSQDHDRVA